MAPATASEFPTSTFVPSYDTCNQASDICPIEATMYGSWFNKPGNYFFLIIFAICAIWQIAVLFKYRTWSFSVFLGIGTIFETVGYGTRVTLATNPWEFTAFTTQLTMLILAPTLVAAAMSITFKHIVIYHGTGASILPPRLYPWIFLGADIISIIIQVAGAAMSSAGNDNSSLMDVATGVLTAGVSFQAANLTFCGGLMSLYWFRLRKVKRVTSPNQDSAGNQRDKREDRRLKVYIYGMVVAYILVTIRSIYRIPEMAGGWGGELMQDETTFLVLDGAMVAIAVLIQSILHPAYLFPAMKRTKDKTKEEKKERKGRSDLEIIEARE